MHPQLLQAVMEINSFQRRHVALKLNDLLEGSDLKGKVIGVLGLAFKENTDDIRESPSLAIIQHLIDEGATVKAYDPVAMENALEEIPEIQGCNDPYETAEGVDALVIATPWNEFKQLDMERIKGLMKSPVLLDGRNIYEPQKLIESAFVYRGVGRGYDGEGVTKVATPGD
jgi:UDPglucose 6-dehydrogenase